MCGGTLKSHAAVGQRVVVVTYTNGVPGGVGMTPVLTQCGAACGILGAEHMEPRETYGTGATTLWRHKDEKLDTVGVYEAAAALEDLLDDADFDPAIVYTHSPADTNQDHRAIAAVVDVATRRWAAQGHPVRAVYAGEVPGSTTRGFRPARFVELDVIAQQAKQAALAAYTAITRNPPHPLSWGMVETRLRWWGQYAYVPADEADGGRFRLVEAFEVVRELGLP